MSRTRLGLLSLAPLVALTGCIGGWFGGLLPDWFGGRGPLPPSPEVDVREVVRFSERIETFYASLENVPMDAVRTFQNPELRDYFASEAAFMDYYSSIANQVRRSNMLNSRPDRVRVNEFRFESPGIARVEVQITGPYQRTLRFWGVELRRTDTWSRRDGVWVLTPDKL